MVYIKYWEKLIAKEGDNRKDWQDGGSICVGDETSVCPVYSDIHFADDGGKDDFRGSRRYSPRTDTAVDQESDILKKPSGKFSSTVVIWVKMKLTSSTILPQTTMDVKTGRRITIS